MLLPLPMTTAIEGGIQRQIAELFSAVNSLSESVQRCTTLQQLQTKRLNQLEAKIAESIQSPFLKHETSFALPGSDASHPDLGEIEKRLAKLENSFALPEREDTGTFIADSDAREPGNSSYTLLSPPKTALTEAQIAWTAQWLEDVEEGELDVYTCLGLSNCFSWTPDTRRIFMKAVAVASLQMVVPFCLLMTEVHVGIELGPAEGDMGFRLVGFTLFGYAIFNMYNGADGTCRANLLNVMFQYKDIPVGNWLPLVAGEISNVFTALVLTLALYSIFTTQTAPADLIMNAVAVNFLCDCDGSFVDKEMRKDAVATFKKLTNTAFLTKKAYVSDPFKKGRARLLNEYALYLIAIGGFLGCWCFMIYHAHEGGRRDVIPGYEHLALDFGPSNSTT